MVTEDQLTELGFTWEQLPSGHWNLWNPGPFKINGIPTIGAVRGKYLMTQFHKTKEAVLTSIRSIELL
jgi:hypothetical protein